VTHTESNAPPISSNSFDKRTFTDRDPSVHPSMGSLVKLAESEIAELENTATEMKEKPIRDMQARNRRLSVDLGMVFRKPAQPARKPSVAGSNSNSGNGDNNNASNSNSNAIPRNLSNNNSSNNNNNNNTSRDNSSSDKGANDNITGGPDGGPKNGGGKKDKRVSQRSGSTGSSSSNQNSHQNSTQNRLSSDDVSSMRPLQSMLRRASYPPTTERHFKEERIQDLEQQKRWCAEQISKLKMDLSNPNSPVNGIMDAIQEEQNNFIFNNSNNNINQGNNGGQQVNSNSVSPINNNTASNSIIPADAVAIPCAAATTPGGGNNNNNFESTGGSGACPAMSNSNEKNHRESGLSNKDENRNSESQQGAQQRRFSVANNSVSSTTQQQQQNSTQQQQQTNQHMNQRRLSFVSNSGGDRPLGPLASMEAPGTLQSSPKDARSDGVDTIPQMLREYSLPRAFPGTTSSPSSQQQGNNSSEHLSRTLFRPVLPFEAGGNGLEPSASFNLPGSRRRFQSTAGGVGGPVGGPRETGGSVMVPRNSANINNDDLVSNVGTSASRNPGGGGHRKIYKRGTKTSQSTSTMRILENAMKRRGNPADSIPGSDGGSLSVSGSVVGSSMAGSVMSAPTSGMGGIGGRGTMGGAPGARARSGSISVTSWAGMNAIHEHFANNNSHSGGGVGGGPSSSNNIGGLHQQQRSHSISPLYTQQQSHAEQLLRNSRTAQFNNNGSPLTNTQQPLQMTTSGSSSGHMAVVNNQQQGQPPMGPGSLVNGGGGASSGAPHINGPGEAASLGMSTQPQMPNNLTTSYISGEQIREEDEEEDEDGESNA